MWEGVKSKFYVVAIFSRSRRTIYVASRASRYFAFPVRTGAIVAINPRRPRPTLDIAIPTASVAVAESPLENPEGPSPRATTHRLAFPAS